MNSKKSLILAGIFIMFGALSRLLITIPNVSVLESLALFGGSYFMLKRFAFIIPLAAYLFSDFIINNTIARVWYPEVEGLVFFAPHMKYTIVGILLIVVFGKFILKKVNLLNGIFGVVGATLIFWLVSNFGSFLSSPMYTKDFAGFASCYALALPFLARSLAGNVFFAALLFGSFEYLLRQYPALIPAKQNV